MNHKWLIFAAVCALSAQGCCCKETEQGKAKRAAKAQAKAKKRAHKAELKARCGDGFMHSAWVATCKRMVRKKFKHPETVSFGFGGDTLKNEKDCLQTYSSTVEAKNAVGISVKHGFVCKYDSVKNWVTVSHFE
jgi:hypothetical protein